MEGDDAKNMKNNRCDTKTISSSGIWLIKVVKKIDSTFAWMLMNTYFVCILSTTANMYSSATILFNRDHVELWILSGSNLLISLLTISRLYWITCCSQRLTASMKKCANHLDIFVAMNYQLATKDLLLLKDDLKYYSEAPINPFSAFSVSTSTLVGAFGTIITYLIVLLQFKASE